MYYGGSTNASGSSGGKILAKAKEVLILDGSIVAKGLKESGGDLMVVSEDVLLSTARTNVDMSGSLNGGSIKLHGDNYNLVTGAFKADGNLIKVVSLIMPDRMLGWSRQIFQIKEHLREVK